MSLTKPNVDREDLGVPASERNVRVCAMCNADVSHDLTICPECGAHLPSSEEIEPMSTSFDSELAKANLLRMRAEFRQAEELCLSVLKRFPNSAAAHTLLGDVYADQGLLEEAAQWYELSLDLDKDSVSSRQKLEDVREQIKERDHISSIEQLGLPEPGAARKVWLTVGGVAVLVLFLGLLYVLKTGALFGPREEVVVSTPIRATPDMDSTSKLATAPVVVKPANPRAVADVAPETGSTAPETALEDRALHDQIVRSSEMGTHLVSVVQDPRTSTATLTYMCIGDEDEKKVGALLAKAALDQSAGLDSVTLRCLKDQRLSFEADMSRAKYAETQNADWQAKQTNPDAWIGYSLSNEWPPAASEGSGSGEGPSPNSTAGATGGSTADKAVNTGLTNLQDFTGVGIPRG